MSRRKKVWLSALGGFFLVFAGGVWWGASAASKRFEPFIREQAVAYLRNRFGTEVELDSLRVRAPKLSWNLLRTRGRGTRVRVEGDGLKLPFTKSSSLPPLFAVRKFAFEVDLGNLQDQHKRVPLVTLEGMDINL